MATTESETLNIIRVPETLDVLEKFECLMKEAVSSESVYIRTKETITQYFKDSSLNSNDKANAIASILGSMSSSVTGAAMQTALQWASAERDLALRKLELAKQLDILDAEKTLKDAQADKLQYDSIATQAETIRVMGTPTVVEGKVTMLADAGKIWQDIQIGVQQEKNLKQEETLIKAKQKESYAGVQKALADSIVNYGAWSYTINEAGITNAPMKTANTVVPLSDAQRIIAQEQAKGYAYNAWANAVTASAGMIGTAMASEAEVQDSHQKLWSTGVGKLNDVELPTIP